MQYDLTSVLYVRTNEVYLPVTDLTMAGYSNSTPKPIKAGHQKKQQKKKHRDRQRDRETEKYKKLLLLLLHHHTASASCAWN